MISPATTYKYTPGAAGAWIENRQNVPDPFGPTGKCS